MTSNIDRLNQIARLLTGSNFMAAFYDKDGAATKRYSVGKGMFHSLEIDNVYPGSKPKVYVRATNVEWKRYDWNSTDVREDTEEFSELVFEIEMIEYIKYSPRQTWDDGFMAEQYIIQFRDRSEARLVFAWL